MNETHPLDILLVEDEKSVAGPLSDLLDDEGHKVTTVFDGPEAITCIAQHNFDLAICDIRLPSLDGLTVFRHLRSQSPQTSVVLMSAYGNVAEAVGAMRERATHYLAKPFEPSDLLSVVSEVASIRVVNKAFGTGNTPLPALDRPATGMIGSGPNFQSLLARIKLVAGSDGAVIVSGESGTGKELVARNIHAQGPRGSKPFVAVNCAAFPDTLLESELFGVERGAFTGASRRTGRFRAAHGGTLFLDEVIEMSPSAQAKLLRVLESGTFEPLGTNTTETVDVRLVSATNSSLAEKVANGQFREDLYYRLRVFEISIPPLRDRCEDIPLLFQHFWRSLGPPQNTGEPKITPAAWAALLGHSYPGNVRELKNVVQHALTFSRGEEIDVHHLPVEIGGGVFNGSLVSSGSQPGLVRPLSDAVKEFEHQYILQALKACSGRKGEAAQKLGVSRKTLWYKLADSSGTKPSPRDME